MGEEIGEQTKARIDAIILLVDDPNIELDRMPLTDGSQRLFTGALQPARVHQIIPGPVRNDSQRYARQECMACQRRDHQADGPIPPYGDHAVGMLATTCKISHIIALPRTTGLRRGMGYDDCAAQDPHGLPDNGLFNFPAVAFRLRVEHQQVLHALPSPHRCRMSTMCHCRPGRKDSQLRCNCPLTFAANFSTVRHPPY